MQYMSEQIPQTPESVTAKVKRLRKEVINHIGMEHFYIELLPPFADQLRQNHPDCGKYRIYHDLVGGTPREGDGIIEEDFPGEDSVVKFLESLLSS